MADLEIEKLKAELGRAYRAVRGFYSYYENRKMPDERMVAYHSPTIGAAMRFVNEGALDGAIYFEGKPVDLLHKALRGEKAASN